jgi:hypothetical protein
VKTKKIPGGFVRSLPSEKKVSIYMSHSNTYQHKFNLNNLPSPAEYYHREFSTIKTNHNWGQVICPFHNDHKPSLSINMLEGYFKCHACGASGGGIIDFHMLRYDLAFKAAVKDLGVM